MSLSSIYRFITVANLFFRNEERVPINVVNYKFNEIKEIIETKGQELIEDIETAKEDLKMIAESVKKKYGVPTGWFTKACEYYYSGNKEEDKAKALAKFDFFEELYEENE